MRFYFCNLPVFYIDFTSQQDSDEGEIEEGEVEEQPTSSSTSHPATTSATSDTTPTTAPTTSTSATTTSTTLAATSAAGSSQDSLAERAKKMRVEEELEKKTLFDVSRVTSKAVMESESCLHEAIVPVDYPWEPLKALAAKPAKEFPFILDPFQLEALKCIQNDRFV